MNPTIDLGFITLPSMGICILVGTIFALILLFRLRRYTPLSRDDLFDVVLWAVFLGFVGMKVLYWIVEPDSLIALFNEFTWDRLVDVVTQGMVFYGGLAGGILGVFICALRKKRCFFTFSDLLAPCFCLSHAGGRIGCLMAGCCYGMEYDGVCHVTLHGVERFPSPIAEFALLIVMAVVLTAILIKSRHRGTTTGWYLIIYSVGRFILEFFRGDAERGFVGGLSTSQFISIFTLVAGIVILLISRRLLKDTDSREKPAAADKAQEPEPETAITEAEEVEPESEPETETLPETEAAPKTEE